MNTPISRRQLFARAAQVTAGAALAATLTETVEATSEPTFEDITSSPAVTGTLDSGLIAYGGWCAPSEPAYDLLFATTEITGLGYSRKPVHWTTIRSI